MFWDNDQVLGQRSCSGTTIIFWDNDQVLGQRSCSGTTINSGTMIIFWDNDHVLGQRSSSGRKIMFWDNDQVLGEGSCSGTTIMFCENDHARLILPQTVPDFAYNKSDSIITCHMWTAFQVNDLLSLWIGWGKVKGKPTDRQLGPPTCPQPTYMNDCLSVWPST